MTHSDRLDVSRIERALPRGCTLGPILVEGTLDSTNSALLEGARAGRYAPGTVLAAEEQTAGRGRGDRTWDSESSSSLTFSILIENPLPSRPGFISIGAALAVCLSVEEMAGIGTAIKWPNDVYLGEAKAAGILAEGFQQQGSFFVVVGFGVNVDRAPRRITDGRQRPATSIRDAAKKRLDRSLLLACIAGHFDEIMARLTDGRRIDVARGLRRRSYLLGRRLRLARSGAIHEGTLEDHTDDLGLVIATTEGLVVVPGEGTDLVDFC